MNTITSKNCFENVSYKEINENSTQENSMDQQNDTKDKMEIRGCHDEGDTTDYLEKTIKKKVRIF